MIKYKSWYNIGPPKRGRERHTVSKRERARADKAQRRNFASPSWPAAREVLA
jgi:hypothetical protein